MWLQEENVGQEVMIEDLTVSRFVFYWSYLLSISVVILSMFHPSACKRASVSPCQAQIDQCAL